MKWELLLSVILLVLHHQNSCCLSPNLELCWSGGLSSKGNNASTRRHAMIPLNWKLRLPPGILYLVQSSHPSSLCSEVTSSGRPSWSPSAMCPHGFLYSSFIAVIMFTFTFVVISANYALPTLKNMSSVRAGTRS